MLIFCVLMMLIYRIIFDSMSWNVNIVEVNIYLCVCVEDCVLIDSVVEFVGVNWLQFMFFLVIKEVKVVFFDQMVIFVDEVGFCRILDWFDVFFLVEEKVGMKLLFMV